jgi:1-phosphofructokinase family hexose kinase
MSTPPILCIGLTPALQHTLTFDGLQAGEVNRARSSLTSAAGKAVNVASVLTRLGSPAKVTGFNGGLTGRQVTELLERQGIEPEWVPVRCPTRQCHTLLDTALGKTTELVEEASLPDPDEWAQLEATLQALIPRARLVVLTGALPLGAPPSIYQRIVEWTAAGGGECLVDAQGEALRAALAGNPRLAKLNRRELAATAGLDAGALRDPGAAVCNLRPPGPRSMLMTDGPEPAWLTDDVSGTWLIRPPAVSVLNPIGCGDAVTAGIAHALAGGRTMLEAVHFGIACGTAAALTRTPGDLDPTRVQSLLPKVRTERVETPVA